MREVRVIQIVNPENCAIYIVKGTELGRALCESSVIATHGAEVVSAKARNGKQVTEYNIKYTIVKD